MTIGCTASALGIGFRTVTRYRGNLDRYWLVEARRYADGVSRAVLLDRYDIGRASPKGLARLVPWWMVFSDNLIHELDVRRPLGIEQSPPAEMLADVLGLCTRLVTPQVPAAWRCRGLTLTARDIDWERPVTGAPEVSGNAEDLILAIAGREAGLRGLSGAGVNILASRIGAHSAV
jgi:uncharacterized protein (TIGR03083 family)